MSITLYIASLPFNMFCIVFFACKFICPLCAFFNNDFFCYFISFACIDNTFTVCCLDRICMCTWPLAHLFRFANNNLKLKYKCTWTLMEWNPFRFTKSPSFSDGARILICVPSTTPTTLGNPEFVYTLYNFKKIL